MSETVTSTTIQSVLQYVVGLNEQVAKRILDNTKLSIDGKAYTHPDQELSVQVGSRIDLEGHSDLTVISAHIRTLDFYRGSGARVAGPA